MWKINNKFLDYGPSNCDYIVVNGVVRQKYVSSEVKMDGTQATRYVHKPSFPTYNLFWPVVTEGVPVNVGATESVYKVLSEVPLYKTIIWHDNTYNLDFNIKVINRLILNLRTIKNGEVLRSAQFTIIFTSDTGV